MSRFQFVKQFDYVTKELSLKVHFKFVFINFVYLAVGEFSTLERITQQI